MGSKPLMDADWRDGKEDWWPHASTFHHVG
jgi:hypothetical protein